MSVGVAMASDRVVPGILTNLEAFLWSQSYPQTICSRSIRVIECSTITFVASTRVTFANSRAGTCGTMFLSSAA